MRTSTCSDISTTVTSARRPQLRTPPPGESQEHSVYRVGEYAARVALPKTERAGGTRGCCLFGGMPRGSTVASSIALCRILRALRSGPSRLSVAHRLGIVDHCESHRPGEVVPGDRRGPRDGIEGPPGALLGGGTFHRWEHLRSDIPQLAVPNLCERSRCYRPSPA